MSTAAGPHAHLRRDPQVVLENPRRITTAIMDRAFLATGTEPEFDDWLTDDAGRVTSCTPLIADALTRGVGHATMLLWAALGKDSVLDGIATRCGLARNYAIGFLAGWFGHPPECRTDLARLGWQDGAKCYAHAAREVYESTWGVTDHAV